MSGEVASPCAPGSEMRFLMGIWWISSLSAMLVAPGLEFRRNPGHLPTVLQCHAAGDTLSLLRAHLSQSVRGAGLLLRLWCRHHLVWCVFGGSSFRLALLHTSSTRFCVSRIPTCVTLCVRNTSLLHPIQPMSNLFDPVGLSQPVKGIL